MTTLEIIGNWNSTKEKLKQKWPTLTDDDLQYIEGKWGVRRIWTTKPGNKRQ